MPAHNQTGLDDATEVPNNFCTDLEPERPAVRLGLVIVVVDGVDVDGFPLPLTLLLLLQGILKHLKVIRVVGN